jgi:hypothetical protein
MSSKLLNKRLFAFGLLIFLYLIFINTILGWFDSLVVKNLLANIYENGWTFYLMAALTLVTLFGFFLAIIENVRLANEFTCIVILILGTYIYYRFWGDRYNYFFWDKVPQVKYSDYFLVLLGGFVLLRIINLLFPFKESRTQGSSFIVDTPI